MIFKHQPSPMANHLMTKHCILLQLSEDKAISFKAARLRTDKMSVKLAQTPTQSSQFSDGLEKISKKKTKLLASHDRNHALAII